MREIRFRAWDKERKQMLYKGTALQMLCLGLTKTAGKFDKGCTQQPKCKEGNDYIGFAQECQLIIMMQYTGLKDSKGKEIYEGDIVRGDNLDYFNPNAKSVAVEYLECGEWYPFADSEDNAPYPKPKNVEVIGNIYEHPKLLKE